MTVQRPSLDDPLVTGASEAIGGPVGSRARPHPWWTPVRVVLAVACVVYLLGMLQKTPCVNQDWTGSDEQRYGAMCYSDVPYLYAGRGFAERVVPFTDTDGRYGDLEYPVLIGYFAYGSAIITHALRGWPDLELRKALPDGEIYGDPDVLPEAKVFFDVTAVLLFLFALGAAYFMAGAHRGRPWDAMPYVASPALVMTGLINWDYLAVFALAGAMWAWARGRPLLAGLFVGLGTAAKLYPLFLLGALFVVCLRRRELSLFAKVAGAAAGGWLLVNLPAILLNFREWKGFWSFNQERGPDLGSIWLVLQQATDKAITYQTVNRVSEIFFVLVCVGVLALGLTARRTPRIAQLAFLILCGFLVINKVYSPQYVMWLLPLAVLARPRWRDILIWTSAEVFYVAAVWLYLGKFTAPSTVNGDDHVYWFAIGIRIAAELWFAGLVVRDILRPWHDPVRADGVTDDPMHPVAAEPRVARRRGAHVALAAAPGTSP